MPSASWEASVGETPEPLKRRLGRKAAEMEKWSFLQRRVVKLVSMRRVRPSEELRKASSCPLLLVQAQLE